MWMRAKRMVGRLWLVVALGACGGGQQAPSEGDPTGGAGGSGGGGVASVPSIGEALASECGSYTPPSGIAPGDDLHRVTLEDPEALCNDGTPAVMFVRPSTGGENANRWVIYLQGGHACTDYESCRVRYCGTEKYTKAKMSSTWTPLVANTDGEGLFDRDGVNPFGEANAVLLYYCSSDQWLGQKSDSVLTDAADPSQQYRLHFRGHTIIEAAFDQFLAGPVTSDDGAITIPALSDAQLVVWAGTSAGATGAEQHADYVAERLAPQGAQVVGLFDANLPPRNSDFAPAVADLLDQADRDTKWPVVYGETYDAWVDASCLSMHPGADAWRCAHNAHVVMNHVTIPFFVRQDLRDRVIGARYLDNGLPMDQLAAAYRATLVDLSDIATTAEEPVTSTPGVYGPNCSQHVALTTEDWFKVATVDNAGGGELTLRGAFVSWFMGGSVDAIDTHPATTSTCPPPADNGE